MDDPFNRGLPKWPQMLVVGDPVTPEQAFDIITRTDTAFNGCWGNSRTWGARMAERLRMPANLYPYGDDLRKNAPHNGHTGTDWDAVAEWKKDWGYVETEYVHNDWVACAYIGGPHGWCAPGGQLQYADNVGKWPSVESLYDDWALLAREFPYVRAHVTFMSGESSEDGTRPVASFLVREGEVVLTEGHLGGLERAFAPQLNEYRSGEQGCPRAWEQRWEARARSIFG